MIADCTASHLGVTHMPFPIGGPFERIRYDTIAEFNVDSKAEYTA